MRAAIYARVSTKSQSVENQIRDLQQVCQRQNWEVVQVFVDEGVSGARGRQERSGLNDLLKGVVRKDFDVVCAWSVDRLGRSLQDLIGILNDLREKDCDLYLHKQGIDTSTSSGKMLFQMLSVFAEFERSLIRERVIAGLERAKAKGVKLGRRPISDDRVHKIRRLRGQGWGMNRISRELRVGSATVQRVLVDRGGSGNLNS